MLTNKFSDALSVANYAHYDQTRKGTTIPYIAHPLAVASLAIEFGATEDQAIAALLHDAIEDGGAEYEQVIQKNFGDEVLAIVKVTRWYYRRPADYFNKKKRPWPSSMNQL